MKAASAERGQLVLDFDHRPALSGDDFLVARPNADAVGWLDAWPAWPGPALVIHGPAGSGKTHLAQVFRQLSGAREVTAAALAESHPPEILAGGRACVLDDADQAVAAGREEALLHLFNHVRDNGATMMLTAARPPARWGIGLKDLASRLNAAQQAGIGAPDDALIRSLLVKQFADRQLRVSDDVVGFLVQRMERSFAAARRLVTAVDKLSLKERRHITVPLARRVLAEHNDESDRD